MPQRYAWKLVSPMLFLSAVLLGVGVFAAWNVQQQQKVSSELIAREVKGMLAIEDLHKEMRELRYQVNLFLRTHDCSHLQAVNDIHMKSDALLESARESAREPVEQTQIDIVVKGYGEFFRQFTSAVDPLTLEVHPEASHGTGDDRVKTTVQPDEALLNQLSTLSDELLTKEVLIPLEKCLDVNKQIVKRTNEASESAARHMTIGFLLLGLCGSAAGILMGAGVGRAIGRSIVQLHVSVRGVADRLTDVRGPITVTHRGDLAGLEIGIKELEEDIAQVVERLQQQERELMRSEQLAHVGQLAAGLAHEFRNPLMPMKMLVQAAIEKGDEGGLRGRSLQVLKDEISRLEASIQAFLDFARPPLPEQRPEDICELVRQTVYLVHGRCEQQDVKTDLLLPEQPVTVFIDRNQVRQLLLNLVLNSLDAMPNGGRIQILVEPHAHPPITSATDKEGPESDADGEYSEHDALRAMSKPLNTTAGDWLLIRLRDDGVGIPPEILSRIFEPFVTSKETGTGLGLSTCKRIAEMHHGRLFAANCSTGGSEFSLYLPYSIHPSA
ncbi:MAG: ATP-binding protein [Pirellulales bacterium]